MGRIYPDSGSPYWYVDYVDANGKRVRKSSGHKDKQNAAALLAKLETEARLIKQGLKAPDDHASKLLIDEQLDKFETSLGVKNGQDHVEDTIRKIRCVVDHNGWQSLADISADGLEYFIEELSDKNRSARNRGAYITAVRTFCRWLVKRGRLPSDPTVSVGKPSVKADRRIKRRMLLKEEWQWITKALADGPDRNRQSAGERLLMYQTAIETGLRSNELRSLAKSDLKLNAGDPYVLAAASTTKNKKEAKQYISDGLKAKLSQHVRRKTPKAEVFSVGDRTAMAETLRRDAADAKALYLQSHKQLPSDDFLAAEDSEGRVIDFHALRHTSGAWLVIAGVNIQEVKQHMRHSTITLTMDTYGHLLPDAASRNRNLLGEMLG